MINNIKQLSLQGDFRTQIYFTVMCQLIFCIFLIVHKSHEKTKTIF